MTLEATQNTLIAKIAALFNHYSNDNKKTTLEKIATLLLLTETLELLVTIYSDYDTFTNHIVLEEWRHAPTEYFKEIIFYFFEVENSFALQTIFDAEFFDALNFTEKEKLVNCNFLLEFIRNIKNNIEPYTLQESMHKNTPNLSKSPLSKLLVPAYLHRYHYETKNKNDFEHLQSTKFMNEYIFEPFIAQFEQISHSRPWLYGNTFDQIIAGTTVPMLQKTYAELTQDDNDWVTNNHNITFNFENGTRTPPREPEIEAGYYESPDIEEKTSEPIKTFSHNQKDFFKKPISPRKMREKKASTPPRLDFNIDDDNNISINDPSSPLLSPIELSINISEEYPHSSTNENSIIQEEENALSNWFQEKRIMEAIEKERYEEEEALRRAISATAKNPEIGVDKFLNWYLHLFLRFFKEHAKSYKHDIIESNAVNKSVSAEQEDTFEYFAEPFANSRAEIQPKKNNTTVTFSEPEEEIISTDNSGVDPNFESMMEKDEEENTFDQSLAFEMLVSESPINKDNSLTMAVTEEITPPTSAVILSQNDEDFSVVANQDIFEEDPDITIDEDHENSISLAEEIERANALGINKTEPFVMPEFDHQSEGPTSQESTTAEGIISINGPESNHQFVEQSMVRKESITTDNAMSINVTEHDAQSEAQSSAAFATAATGLPLTTVYANLLLSKTPNPSTNDHILKEIKICLRTAATDYLYAEQNIHGSIRHRHGATGRKRATDLITKLDSILTIEAMETELQDLFAPKTFFRLKGNDHDSSLKTFVLKELAKNNTARTYIWEPNINNAVLLLVEDEKGRKELLGVSSKLKSR